LHLNEHKIIEKGPEQKRFLRYFFWYFWFFKNNLLKASYIYFCSKIKGSFGPPIAVRITVGLNYRILFLFLKLCIVLLRTVNLKILLTVLYLLYNCNLVINANHFLNLNCLLFGRIWGGRTCDTISRGRSCCCLIPTGAECKKKLSPTSPLYCKLQLKHIHFQREQPAVKMSWEQVKTENSKGVY
jgi:hypothetical protein